MRAGGPFTRGAHTFQGVWAPEMVSKAGLGVSARPSLNALRPSTQTQPLARPLPPRSVHCVRLSPTAGWVGASSPLSLL